MARPTGSMTFFFSDVEGSTRLLMALGERYAAPHGEHQRIVRSAIASHGGMEVSTEGDSFFAVFVDAGDALNAAADIQRGLATHPWPAGAEFRVRIGLHTGQAVVAGDDYVGLDVNRAARIGNAANGGQTVVSEAARAAAGTLLSAGTELRDLGRHRLKDVGVERLWQLDVAGVPSNFGPLRSLEAHPTNLPTDRTSLVGRSAEIETLAALVRESSLVTVTGAGGVGKSRLAIAVARSMVEAFPDGVFYLDLAQHDDPLTMLSELAIVSDTRLPPDEDPTDAFVERFVRRSALLVFDTADRLREFGTLASRLLDGCPEIRILVTARMPLHLAAEREFPLSTLELPPERAKDLATITASPAVELFVRRAQAVRPGFSVTLANGPTIAAIVARLDGLPLAIELGAARMRVFTPDALLARLDRRLPVLRGGAVDAPERQRTVQATIAWSYELLEPAERVMFGRLSVFAGAFDLESALVVAGEPGSPASATDPMDPTDVLERLVDRSLVSTMSRTGSNDFRFIEIIREFAADAFASDPDADAVRDRYAARILDIVEASDRQLDGPDEPQALDRLERWREDIRAVLEWSLGDGSLPAGPDHLGLRLARAMGRAWYLHGRAREGSELLERALAADPDAPLELRANALHLAGVLNDERGQSARAMAEFEASLALVRGLGDDRRVARELNSVGVVARNVGDTDRAAAYFEESLAMRRASADLPGIATTLSNLGVIAIDRGRYQEARTLLEEAVSLDRASGAAGAAAYSTLTLGTALLRLGERPEAVDLLRGALTTFAALDNDDGVAESLERLGEAVLGDDPSASARLLSAAIEIRRRADIPVRPADKLVTQRLEQAVEATVEPGVLAAARAEAAAMDLEAATAYALAADLRGRRCATRRSDGADAAVDTPGEDAADHRDAGEDDDRRQLGHAGHRPFDDEHRGDGRAHRHPLDHDDGRQNVAGDESPLDGDRREQAERDEEPEVECLDHQRRPAVELRDRGGIEGLGDEWQPHAGQQHRHEDAEAHHRPPREGRADPRPEGCRVDPAQEQSDAGQAQGIRWPRRPGRAARTRAPSRTRSTGRRSRPGSRSRTAGPAASHGRGTAASGGTPGRPGAG